MQLRRFRLAAVVKVSVAFYAIAAVLFSLFAAAIYLVGGNFGLVAGVDRLAVRVFGASPGFHLGAVTFVAGAAVVAASVGLIGVVFNTVAAILYNRIGELTGGVSVTLSPASAAEGAPGRRRP